MLELASRSRIHRPLRVSAQKMGWAGIKNGRLLSLAAEHGFDIFLTGDRNLSFQQNLNQYAIAVVVLEASGVQLRQTLPLIPKVLELLPSVKPGAVFTVSG